MGSSTDISFTGHKWLQSAQVTHMKGRVYDPVIGRFLSADPHIQSPLNSQSLNRYSYVHNNPLSFTDPSGYFLGGLFKAFKKLFKAIARIIKKIAKIIQKVVKAIAKVIKKIGQFIKKYYKVIIAVVVAVAVVYFTVGAGSSLAAAGLEATLGQVVAAGALAGGASGLIMTGSIKGMLEGAMFGAITAGFAHSVKIGVEAGKGVFSGLKSSVEGGINFAHRITQVVGHGIIGGLRSVVNGGKFLTGALTGAIGKLVTFGTSMINSLSENPFLHGLVVATAGGLTSMLAGGSFEMGFLTAGLAFATNKLMTNTEFQRSGRKFFSRFGKWFDYTFNKPQASVSVFEAGIRNVATASFGVNHEGDIAGSVSVAGQPLVTAGMRQNGEFFHEENGNKDLFSNYGNYGQPAQDLSLVLSYRGFGFDVNMSSVGRILMLDLSVPGVQGRFQ